MTQHLVKIDVAKLKAVLDLKELEDREILQRPTYTFVEPERAGFTYMEIPAPVRVRR